MPTKKDKGKKSTNKAPPRRKIVKKQTGGAVNFEEVAEIYRILDNPKTSLSKQRKVLNRVIEILRDLSYEDRVNIIGEISYLESGLFKSKYPEIIIVYDKFEPLLYQYDPVKLHELMKGPAETAKARHREFFIRNYLNGSTVRGRKVLRPIVNSVEQMYQLPEDLIDTYDMHANAIRTPECPYLYHVSVNIRDSLIHPYKEAYNRKIKLDNRSLTDICEDLEAQMVDVDWLYAQKDYIDKLSVTSKQALKLYTYQGDTLLTMWINNGFVVNSAVMGYVTSKKIHDKIFPDKFPDDMPLDMYQYTQEWLIEFYDSLTSIINNAPPLPRDAIVFRGMSSSNFILKPNRFISTTLTSVAATEFARNRETQQWGMMLKITLPAGSRCLFMAPISDVSNEFEILLPPNTLLKLTKPSRPVLYTIADAEPFTTIDTIDLRAKQKLCLQSQNVN
jgi:hypothetical protein